MTTRVVVVVVVVVFVCNLFLLLKLAVFVMKFITQNDRYFIEVISLYHVLTPVMLCFSVYSDNIQKVTI